LCIKRLEFEITILFELDNKNKTNLKMSINNLRKKLAFELADFLNKRNLIQVSPKIEIDSEMLRFLVENGFQYHRYIQSDEIIRRLRLGQFLTHQQNQIGVRITRIEFKLNKIKVKSIKKRIRSIQVKSPIYLSIRMVKCRTLNNAAVQNMEEINHLEMI
jgi:hypothetical protein